MKSIINLQVTSEKYERLQQSEAALVVQYVDESGNVTSAYIDHMGTREECEDEAGRFAGRFFIVPKNIKAEYIIVDTSEILPPDKSPRGV